MNTLIAIDPGAAGGIAIQKGEHVETHKMPETPRDLCDILERALQSLSVDDSFNVKCYMEQVGGFAGVGQPGSAMFQFGQGFGEIIGILTALKIPFELVRPQKWIIALSLGTKGLLRANQEDLKRMSAKDAVLEKARIASINSRLNTAWKNRLKERAQRLHPTLKVTLAVADALLILEYARKDMALPRMHHARRLRDTSAMQ